MNDLNKPASKRFLSITDPTQTWITTDGLKLTPATTNTLQMTHL